MSAANRFRIRALALATAMLTLASCGGGGTSLGDLKSNAANKIPPPPGAVMTKETALSGGRGNGNVSYGPTIQRSYTVTGVAADVASWYDTRLRAAGWQPGGYVSTGTVDNSGISSSGGRQYTHGKMLFDVTGFLCVDVGQQVPVGPPRCNPTKARQFSYETFLSAP